MISEPLIVERTYAATIEKVWKAITDKDEMKQWYFELNEFRPEPGFEFQFEGKSETRTYLHLCKILEVIPQRKLRYSWAYQDFPGYSIVTFELFPEGNMTRLRLTHEGLESFPQDMPDFAVNSFTQGWNEIIGTLLKNYLEKQEGS